MTFFGRRRSFVRTSKLTSLYYEINGRNIYLTLGDNLFRHGCIQRHNIQRKSYPWCKDAFLKGNLPVYTFSPLVTHQMLKWICQRKSLENPTKKLLWKFEEVFQISKSAWWTDASLTILKEKLLSEVKLTGLLSWCTKTRKKKKYCLPWHITSP